LARAQQLHRLRPIINHQRDHMSPSTDARVATLLTILRATQGEHRGRTRISLSYLAGLADIPPRQIGRYLAMRPVREAMTNYRWQKTTSAALGLPLLEQNPYSVRFLARLRD
jgi:hypothetical protein